MTLENEKREFADEPVKTEPDWAIPYYDHMMQEARAEITDSIRLLLRQTFLLERKYDKSSGRFQYSPQYRSCSRHLEFIRHYFLIGGIELLENTHLGIIYIQGEGIMGDKLSRLATLYLLALKLIYDEQMESVSTSINVYTTLGEIHEKLGSYRLFKRQPAPTDIRRTITLLKKYQLIEPLELLDDLNVSSRMIIYPCINVVLLGDDVRQLLASFAGDGSDDGEMSPEETPEASASETEEGRDTDGNDTDESDTDQ